MVYLFLNFGLIVFLSGTAICFFHWDLLFAFISVAYISFRYDSSILHQLLILQHM